MTKNFALEVTYVNLKVASFDFNEAYPNEREDVVINFNSFLMYAGR